MRVRFSKQGGFTADVLKFFGVFDAISHSKLASYIGVEAQGHTVSCNNVTRREGLQCTETKFIHYIVTILKIVCSTSRTERDEWLHNVKKLFLEHGR